MIFKKMMHFFCGRSLEKETAKTNRLIREAEQREKAVMERLKNQADDYRGQIATYKKKHDAELKEFIAFMNQQLGLAESYVPHLGDFQDKMFVCFDSWMNTSIAEQKIQLLSERIAAKFQMLDFITTLQMEMNRLTQRNERREWRQMIKERPILVSSTFIERTARKVIKSQKSSNRSIRDDINRLTSHSQTLHREIKELCHERDQLIASSREVIEKHKAHKTELNNLYRKCSELFSEISTGFSDHFGTVATKNNLADSWIAGIESSVTMQKLFSTYKETADLQRKVQDDFNNLNHDLQQIRSRIAASRQSGDFSTFDADKSTRNRLSREYQEVGGRRREIITARKVIRRRGNELKEMLGKFDSLQPDESIRRIVEIFRMGKDFDVHRNIGVSTREDRRNHYKLKNQRR